MNRGEYQRMYELEKWYWWFVARRSAAVRLFQRFRPPGRRLTLLDAGCGTGALLDDLLDVPDVGVLGMDISEEALAWTYARGHRRIVQADLTRLPLRSESFDCVTALDVLEHVEDDVKAVQEIHRVLRPGGILIATVPAYQWLWSSHDAALHHFRRYSRIQFLGLLQEAGLAPAYSSFLVTALFPAAVLSRIATRGRGDASLPAVPGLVNRALIGWHRLEAQAALRCPLPYGLTLAAVARKPLARRAGVNVPAARLAPAGLPD